MTGLITNYINAGLAASRPATPSVATGAFGLYYATDTSIASIYAGGSWNALSASAVPWGGITGTLSAQTDLNTALAAKVPTTTTVTAGTGLTGGGALSSNITLNLASTAVTAGSYTHASITVDAQGRITAASSGTVTSGTVTTTGSPASGNLAKFSGATSIVNGDLSGDVTTSGTLATTIASNAVTTAKINNAAVTLAKIANAAANSVLVGAGASGSGAAYSEITLGNSLAIVGTVLNTTVGQQSTTSTSAVTPTFSNDIVTLTAQAAALTINNPTGTAIDGWGLVIRIKDNGTARAITFDTQFRAMGVTLPTTTVISKWLYISAIYNATDTKWDVVGVLNQA